MITHEKGFKFHAQNYTESVFCIILFPLKRVFKKDSLCDSACADIFLLFVIKTGILKTWDSILCNKCYICTIFENPLTFKNGSNISVRRAGGKLDFGHHFAFLTIFLKR